MLLATPVLSDAATLTAGSEASDLPATNLQKMQPSSLWRATDLGNSYLVVDLGEFQSINLLALLYTNASSGATVRVRGADTEAELTSSPGYDSGSVDHWPATGMESWDYTHFLYFPSSAQTYRWWRFDISDANNPDGFYQAGRLYIADAFAPALGPRYGFNVRYRDGQVRSTALGNQIYPQQRNVGRVLNASLRWNSEADFWREFSRLQRMRGTARDVLFVALETNTDRLMDWSAMGVFTDLEPLTYATYSSFEASLTITELLGVPQNVQRLTPEISIADASASEDAGSISFTLTRSVNTHGACSVMASTADGTATAGSDYTAKTETVDFDDGETTKQFVVTLLDDAMFEGDETFAVNLTKPIDCTITDDQATGTITDDDPNSASGALTAGDAQLSGSASVSTVASGVLAAGDATLSSDANTIITASGTLQAGDVGFDATVSVDLISASTLFHSVARAIGNYSGSLIRVRRSSDNAEQDIGADGNGDLDESALTTFVGANDGYLVRVYEQISGTYHLEQTTAANQPRIVNAGTAEKDNGKPAAYIVSGSNHLATASFSSAIAQPDTIFAVYHIEDVSASSDQFVIDSNTTSPDRQFLGTNNQNWTSYAASFIGSSASASSIQVIHTGLFDGANSEIWINGSSQATGNPGSSALGCLEWNSTANNPMVSGWIQETVIYDSDQTSNRSVIESNIADYYGITI